MALYKVERIDGEYIAFDGDSGEELARGPTEGNALRKVARLIETTNE